MGNSNSGRNKAPETVAKECGIQFSRNAVALHQALIDKALAGNLEALTYLFDRHWGRPRTTADIEIKQTAQLTPEQLSTIRQVFIGPVTPTIEGQYKEIPATTTTDTPDT